MTSLRRQTKAREWLTAREHLPFAELNDALTTLPATMDEESTTPPFACDVFEHLARTWLLANREVYQLTNVYLHDFPPELGLTDTDVGVDIVGVRSDSTIMLVQVKYSRDRTMTFSRDVYSKMIMEGQFCKRHVEMYVLFTNSERGVLRLEVKHAHVCKLINFMDIEKGWRADSRESHPINYIAPLSLPLRRCQFEALQFVRERVKEDDQTFSLILACGAGKT